MLKMSYKVIIFCALMLVHMEHWCWFRWLIVDSSTSTCNISSYTVFFPSRVFTVDFTAAQRNWMPTWESLTGFFLVQPTLSQNKSGYGRQTWTQHGYYIWYCHIMYVNNEYCLDIWNHWGPGHDSLNPKNSSIFHRLSPRKKLDKNSRPSLLRNHGCTKHPGFLGLVSSGGWIRMNRTSWVCILDTKEGVTKKIFGLYIMFTAFIWDPDACHLDICHDIF